MRIMKLLAIALTTLLVLASCEKNDTSTPQISLGGTWQLKEVFIDIGDGNGTWETASNPYQYTFQTDGTYTTSRFDDCNSGKYTLRANELELDFDCNSLTIGNQSFTDSIIEEITFEDDHIILKPTYVICTEGCGFKFEKVE